MATVANAFPAISERMTWAEICARHPDEYVCVVEFDDEPGSREPIKSGRVALHGKTPEESWGQARLLWDRYSQIGYFTTGRRLGRSSSFGLRDLISPGRPDDVIELVRY